MNTFLSAAQEARKEQFRQFAANHLADKAGELASADLFRKSFLQPVAQSGYLGLSVAHEYGGQGGSLVDVALLAEALGEHDSGLGLVLANHYAVVEVLQRFGTDTLKSRYLPLLARGEALAALAFSEPNAGTDFEAVETAVQSSGDQFVISGSKTCVAAADVASVFLILGRKQATQSGELALLIADIPQPDIAAARPLLGLPSARCGDIRLQNLKVKEDNRLGEGDSARGQVLHAVDVAAVVLAAAAVGIMDAATTLSVDHARNRRQFGKNIGQFQAVQWKLADMSVEKTGARLQVLRAAWAQAGEPQSFPRYAAMCKWFATRAARLHTGEALQILGASGLAAGCAAERFYRDAKTMEVAAGTSEFHKMRLVQQLDI